MICSLLVWTAIVQYFFCPRFEFAKPSPFRGSHLYNPYQNIDSTKWIKCNFHAHSNAWRGFTNGEGDPYDIWQAYDSLGYGVHLVSDYHKIDFSFEYKENFIAAYEHGYNVQKAHYLVLGNSSIGWRDFIFHQLTSNKQRTLNELSREGSLVIISHPKVRDGFTDDDLRHLSNYHYIEALSSYANSVEKWDVALSAGKAVFASASDDIHNVFNFQNVGRYCTWVNASNNGDGILKAMKQGASYAMAVSTLPQEDNRSRVLRLQKNLPRLIRLSVVDSIIQASFNQPATIVFTGQQGVELARSGPSRSASYRVRPNDSFVRTTATFADGTTIYLNPVFRYQDVPWKTESPPINQAQSVTLAACGYLLLFGWGLLVFRLTTRKSFKFPMAFPR